MDFVSVDVLVSVCHDDPFDFFQEVIFSLLRNDRNSFLRCQRVCKRWKAILQKPHNEEPFWKAQLDRVTDLKMRMLKKNMEIAVSKKKITYREAAFRLFTSTYPPVSSWMVGDGKFNILMQIDLLSDDSLVTDAIKSKFTELQRNLAVIVSGLDNAGKTTALRKLNGIYLVNPLSIFGLHAEKMSIHNIQFDCWDSSVQTAHISRLCQYMIENSDAYVHFVNSIEIERLEESANELHRIVGMCKESNRPEKFPVLIYASMQDLPGALLPEEIREAMQVELFPEWVEYHVCGSVAHTRTGLLALPDIIETV